MKIKHQGIKKLSLAGILLFLLINLQVSAGSKQQIYAGVAKIDFTPASVPDSMIRDHQFIRVLAFSDGENKALFITHENISTPEKLWEGMTKRIQEETGISPEFVLMSGLHNHTGVKRGPDFNDKMMACIKEALANLHPVQIGAGKGECKMNMNRRARATEGGIYLGKNPYGPCDHEVAVLRVDDEQGDPLSIMVNWPCHAVVNFPGCPLFTGDWPGATAKFVEKAYQNKVIVPVTIGASGDINPIYRWGPTDAQPTAHGVQEPIDVTAMDLSLETKKVVDQIVTYPSGAITSVQRNLALPGKKSLEGSMERYQARLPNQPVIPGDSLHVRLTALKVGNIVFAGFGGEVMTEIGMELKEKSPYTNTFVITHCNGSAGYLVTDKALKEGGLEAARMLGMPGTSKALIDNMLEMINEL